MQKTFFIVYEVVKDNNGDIKDIRNLYDNDNREKIAEYLGIDYKNLSHYTAKDIDNINCKLKDNKYFIFKDYE